MAAEQAVATLAAAIDAFLARAGLAALEPSVLRPDRAAARLGARRGPPAW